MLQVPWEDLRYIFGEIMYGGHIVEDWDRRLASAYLLKYFQESLSDGLTLFSGFATPPTNLSYVQVRSQTQIWLCWLMVVRVLLPSNLPLHYATLQRPCQVSAHGHERLPDTTSSIP